MKMAFTKLRGLAAGLALFTLSLPFAGCAPGGSQVDSQASPELEKLRAENREVQELRRENQELPRLRKDNEELHRLRREVGEIPALRQANEQLRAQAAQRGNRLANVVANQAGAPAGAPTHGSVIDGDGELPVDPNDPALADVPQEGDEILIEPKLLGKLLPGFDWDKIERTEPIAVRALLEQQGIVLTNYQQLVSFGITNYIIRRQPQPPPTENPIQ